MLQRAGCTNVLELHGDLMRARCAACGAMVSMASAVEMPGAPPRCACGGPLRPNVVWFGETLPEETMLMAVEATNACDLFVSVGTSGQVFPAAGLIEIARREGALVVEINPEGTPMSALADLRLTEPAGLALPWLGEAIERCRAT